VPYSYTYSYTRISLLVPLLSGTPGGAADSLVATELKGVAYLVARVAFWMLAPVLALTAGLLALLARWNRRNTHRGIE
jgi:hypothetical protein